MFLKYFIQKLVTRNFSKRKDTTKPEKCSFCNFCSFKDVCEEDWKKNRHLNQVGGINKINIKKLKENGVETIDDLGKLKNNTKILGLREEIVKKRIDQAKLQLEFEKTGIPIFKNINENLYVTKGFNLLPKPSEGDYFLISKAPNMLMMKN